MFWGYKSLGRGINFEKKNQDKIKENQTWLADNVVRLGQQIDTISFDNLAIEQLNMEEKISPEDFATNYMGGDGQYTFYIDLVHAYFAKNSLSEIHYPIGSKTVDEMFATVRDTKIVERKERKSNYDR